MTSEHFVKKSSKPYYLLCFVCKQSFSHIGKAIGIMMGDKKKGGTGVPKKLWNVFETSLGHRHKIQVLEVSPQFFILSTYIALGTHSNSV